MNRVTLTGIAERMADAIGIGNITRERLCSEAGIPDGSFTHIIGETFTAFITSLAFDNIMITKSRVAPEFRRMALLESAVMVASRDGWQKMTRDAIAELSKVSPALVSYALGDMKNIKRIVIREAIKRGIVSIIAEGITYGDPEALTVPKKLRSKVNKYIAGL
jgi:DNA-binding transcriptional regulator YbjK